MCRMQRIDERASAVAPVIDLQSHLRHQSRDRHADAGNGTYGYSVPASASSDPRVQAFGRFIKRALVEARERGMSTDEIEQRTGLRRSTLYRWSRAEISSPQRDLVQQFCDGLGIPVTTASQILGWDGSPPSAEPEPSVDPDLRAVMRRLNDPAVTTEEKTTIRQMLKFLARGK